MLSNLAFCILAISILRSIIGVLGRYLDIEKSVVVAGETLTLKLNIPREQVQEIRVEAAYNFFNCTRSRMKASPQMEYDENTNSLIYKCAEDTNLNYLFARIKKNHKTIYAHKIHINTLEEHQHEARRQLTHLIQVTDLNDIVCNYLYRTKSLPTQNFIFSCLKRSMQRSKFLTTAPKPQSENAQDSASIMELQ